MTIDPVPFTDVALRGDSRRNGFWAERIRVNREVTIPHAFEQNETTGRVDNFRKAAGRMEGDHQGERYNDTDVYKVFEGAAYSLAVEPDPELDARLDALIEVIGKAQEADGYLFTPRTVDPSAPPPGIGETRWSNLAVSHELYNAGHLYEAAVAHFQATGKRSLLEVALRNADLVAATFGLAPGQIRGAPGHQVIEMGLAKLYRVTGERRYLDLARYFLDQRGRDLELRQYPEGNRFALYNDPVQIQAHLPVLEQAEAVGHAVRAMYQVSGMVDVAALRGDVDLLAAADRLWEDVAGRKLYLTGGVGGRAGNEAFGWPYDLPNAEAYAETCASIGLVFWSWRLYLAHGDASFLDVLERALYNNVAAGVSLSGDRFFYPNPLASDGERPFNHGAATRQPWFGVACCPGNVARLLPALPGYLLTTRGGGQPGIDVVGFASSEATVRVAGEPVTIRQQTDYPWDGGVRIEIEPLRPARFTLRVRIPGWARGEPVPTDLYRYLPLADGAPAPRLSIGGVQQELRLERGFAVIAREWKPGDVVELVLPMPVRRVVARPEVESARGRVALERGPLVFAVEGIDNGGRALDAALRDDVAVEAAWDEELLGGMLTLRAGELVAIPYFAWSNRGPGEMAVWLERPAVGGERTYASPEELGVKREVPPLNG
ncbi:MAG TPA: beta-L-arabinofuranosidase domain-containing protein [Thermoanaerobaculia bacterium]|nr:beta-L-arabinofuranosidase domain-containing protein [Thermoanaerobaculia bacterium]